MTGMAKNAQNQPTTTVRSATTGRLVTVRGEGALKGSKFAIRKGLDLTKPIASQALKDTRGRKSG